MSAPRLPPKALPVASGPYTPSPLARSLRLESASGTSRRPGARPAQHLGQLQARARLPGPPAPSQCPGPLPRAGPLSQPPPVSRAAPSPTPPAPRRRRFSRGSSELPRAAGSAGGAALPVGAARASRCGSARSRCAAVEWLRCVGRGALGPGVDTAFRCPLATTPRPSSVLTPPST